jgi:hypothetical protein
LIVSDGWEQAARTAIIRILRKDFIGIVLC